MIVTKRQVKSFKLSVCVASIQMYSAVAGHEVESFVHDGQSFLKSSLFEERRAHVIIGKPNLHRYFVLETLAVHELGSAFQITQSLIVVVALSVDRGAQQEQFSHVMEEFESLADQFET